MDLAERFNAQFKVGDNIRFKRLRLNNPTWEIMKLRESACRWPDGAHIHFSGQFGYSLLEDLEIDFDYAP